MSNFTRSRTYTPGKFTDVNENEWYGYYKQKSIADAYEFNLVRGVDAAETKFDPDKNITIAELITLATHVHRIYMGREALVQGEPWYQVYINYAIANNIIAANDFTDLNRMATRAEMAYIFSRSLPQSEFAAQNTVNTLPDVTAATPYSESIFMLYRAGVMTGNDNAGTFFPGNYMTRAEAAAIISHVILPSTRASGRTF
jgi:hypothetical protein